MADILTEEEKDVLSRISRATAVCKPWHEQIEMRRRMYNFEHYNSGAQPGEQRYLDPTYMNTVDLSVGILLGNEMKWHAINWKPDVAAQIEGDSIEKFLNGVIEANNFREEYNIPYEVYLNFTRDGAGVLYSPWDVNIANRVLTQIEEPDEESETSMSKSVIYEEPPILVQVIDPLKIITLPTGPKRWGMIACLDKMNAYDVENKFEVSLGGVYSGMSDEDKMTSEGNLIDYWELGVVKKTKKVRGISGVLPYTEQIVRHAVLYEEEFIIRLEDVKGYKDLPYTIGFFKPVDKGNPKQWSQSIIDPLVPSVDLLEKSVNRRQHQIDVYTSLPILARTRGGKKLVFDPGMAMNVVNLDVEDEVSFPLWQGNAPDIQNQIDFVRARVQQSGFSDVMFGSGQSMNSGYALSQLGDQNRIRLEQPVIHLEMLWSTWAKKILDLTEHFAESRRVRVFGRSRGQDFTEMVRGTGLSKFLIKCEIKPEFPNEKVRNHAMATQVKGLLDDVTIMENYLGIEQPSDVQTRKIAQQALNNPVMLQYAMLKQFRALADTDPDAKMTLQMLEQQILAAEQQAKGNNPEQLTGTQSPTGQPTPQAMGGPPPGQGEEAMVNGMAGMSPQMTSGEIE